MEAQDNIIIKSLQRLKLPIDSKANQEVMNFENMKNIIIGLLNLYEEDTKVQKNFNKPNQRFKCSQRAINQLKKHEISVETPALINPAVVTTRKFFLQIIAKTKLQEKEIEKKIKTPFERIIEERKAKQTKILKNFMGKQWVHPDLQEPEELKKVSILRMILGPKSIISSR